MIVGSMFCIVLAAAIVRTREVQSETADRGDGDVLGLGHEVAAESVGDNLRAQAELVRCVVGTHLLKNRPVLDWRAGWRGRRTQRRQKPGTKQK